MGFLVFVPGLPQPGQNTAFHLIDGQQRLTTLSILLAAIRNVARENKQTAFAEEIHQYYLVHPLKKGEQHYRLLPKERDHDTYLAIVDGKREPTGRMAEALAYFENQLTEKAGENADALRSIFDTVCQRLEFMCATLESENAYNIFKSLNSTGVALSASDLIRNFVFMHVAADEQAEFDRESWAPLEARFTNLEDALEEERLSRFFRDFLMSSGRYISPKETFNEFEARYEATDFSPKALASALLKASAHYDIICGRRADTSFDVTDALGGLNVFDSPTTYPLLLALFSLRDSGAIDSAGLARAICMLKGFLLRRFICNESSRGYGRMFVRALVDAEGEPIAALEEYLLERGWPDDLRFETAFVQFPLYQRGYTKEVITGLERARGHKEPADLSEAQVEHIMPQTMNADWRKALGQDADRIHTTWLDCPGNLTLSGYNQELWNHKFTTKRLRYAQSNIVLTRELAEFESWGETEIRERGLALAKEAAKLWIGPDQPPAAPDTANDGEGHDGQTRFEIRKQFWEGLSDYLQSEHPSLPRFEGRPVWTIRLPSSIRHVGIETRLGLRNHVVGIDIWFWRQESMPLWNAIRQSPETHNAAVGATWGFEQIKDKPRARIFIELPIEKLRDSSSWPTAYEWFGTKLTSIYGQLVPLLRSELEAA